MIDPPPHYAVRFTPRANREAVDASLRLEEISGEDVARQWYSGLQIDAGTLTEQPRRYAVLERESRQIGQEVRRMLYRRSQGSAPYLVYYIVEDESGDGPRVIIFHIHHSARKPLTGPEARELRRDL